MKKIRLSSFSAGILSVACYVTFSILAFKRYPFPLSPTTNWLSDLGNPLFNPSGAILYNTGIVVTALILMLFFIGLSVLAINEKSAHVIIFRITQVMGVLGSVAMVMSGVFPISTFKIHAFWSTSLYILLSSSFLLVSVLLYISHRAPLWILVLGSLSAALVILTGIFPTAYLLEWITVLILFSCLISVGVITKCMPDGRRLSSR